jgi:hypothetical protein
MPAEPAPRAPRRLPGQPLSSGFEYKPASDFPQLELSDEARREVTELLDSVDEARLSAAEGSRQTYVG